MGQEKCTYQNEINRPGPSDGYTFNYPKHLELYYDYSLHLEVERQRKGETDQSSLTPQPGKFS